jgi:hypothetical protein
MTRYKDSTDDAAAEYYEIQRIKAAAAKEERERLIAMLKEQNVIRNCSATGKLVFINCNTMEVLYLKDSLIEGRTE